MFRDLYFVSSDVEINFSLEQKHTVLLMCCWRGQLLLIRDKENVLKSDNSSNHAFIEGDSLCRVFTGEVATVTANRGFVT